jgi:hypothetical protein
MTKRRPGRSARDLRLRIFDRGMRPTTFEGFRMVMQAAGASGAEVADAVLASQLNVMTRTVTRWRDRLQRELEQERLARLTPIERSREKRIQQLHKRRAQLARKGYRV